jgi:hypothetical protein
MISNYRNRKILLDLPTDVECGSEGSEAEKRLPVMSMYCVLS